jgi:poly-gamma-glutamate capsule biosynthesis protein CapA/YwtB (metallophosphatase superfamily)
MSNDAHVLFAAVGDIGFHRTLGASLHAKGPDWLFEKMAPALARADLLFGNMESIALPPDFPPDQVDPKGLIAAASGPECAAALKRAGFNFLNMAANHVLDAGTTGMFHTQATLRAAGMVVGGIGRTQTEARQMQIIEKNGLRFGFLCYCEDNNYSLGSAGPGHHTTRRTRSSRILQPTATRPTLSWFPSTRTSNSWRPRRSRACGIPVPLPRPARTSSWNITRMCRRVSKCTTAA